MSTCEALATKAELKALEQKLIQELRNKANQAELKPIQAGLAEATAVGLAAKGAAELFNRRVDQKVAKATFDAALAGKKATQALRTGTSALGQAGKALSTVGKVIGILGGLANMAALAALTAQFSALKKLVEKKLEQQREVNVQLSTLIHQVRGRVGCNQK